MAGIVSRIFMGMLKSLCGYRAKLWISKGFFGDKKCSVPCVKLLKWIPGNDVDSERVVWYQEPQCGC